MRVDRPELNYVGDTEGHPDAPGNRTLVKPADIDSALDILTDPRLTIEDRAGAYGLLHQIQLRINRRLKSVRDELIVYIETNKLKALGPLSIKSSAIDPRYVVNDPGNWGDFGVQDELAEMAKLAHDYIRHIPEHYEIDTAALGEGCAMGDPVAQQLLAHAKARGWRTEEGRRLSLAVKEVKEAA